jgi:hypothetical protein
MSEERLYTEQPVPLEWHEVWLRALTKPSVATFEEIVTDPHASTNRAYKWVFVMSLVSQAIGLLGGWLTGRSLYNGPDPWEGVNTTLWSIICSPVGAGIAVLSFIISVGILQWIAGLLEGSGRFDDLVFAAAAYQAPLAAVAAVFSLIMAWLPAAACLGAPLFLYLAVLHVMAIKAVNRFNWGRAVATVLAPLGVLLLVVCVITFIGVAVLGPVLENALEGWIQV